MENVNDILKNKYTSLELDAIYDITEIFLTAGYHNLWKIHKGKYKLIKIYDTYLLFKSLKTGVNEGFINNKGVIRLKLINREV